MAAIAILPLSPSRRDPISIENDSQLARLAMLPKSIRELMKSGTLALLLAGSGFVLGYGLTGSVEQALAVALVGSSAGSFLYLLHKRVWRAIDACSKPADGGYSPGSC